jgi:hypothetical protein
VVEGAVLDVAGPPRLLLLQARVGPVLVVRTALPGNEVGGTGDSYSLNDTERRRNCAAGEATTIRPFTPLASLTATPSAARSTPGTPEVADDSVHISGHAPPT